VCQKKTHTNTEEQPMELKLIKEKGMTKRLEILLHSN